MASIVDENVGTEINVSFGIHRCSAQKLFNKSNVIERGHCTCDSKTVKDYSGTSLFIGNFSIHFRAFCLQHPIFEIYAQSSTV
jgi:hypothetical protein